MDKIKFSLEKLILVFVVINFLVICFPLFEYPPPQNLYPDSPSHYKMIELIKEDIKYLNYNPGYRKSFHLMTAFISNFLAVGYSMALVTTIFVGLLILFSFKLAFLLTKNKVISLLSALLASGVTIVSDVGPIPSPVPQTIGLALGTMAVYYFFKEDWKKTGVVIAFYSITHSSYIFFLALMVFASIAELFKENKLNKLTTLVKSSVFVVILALLITLSSLYNSMSNFHLSPKVGLLSDISPLSLLHITFPYGMILVALAGIFLLKRKVLTETNYLTLLLWFVLPILFSQSYWIELQLFPSSRTLIFMLFPLAFFSAKTFSSIKNDKTVAFISVTILILSFVGHFYFYEELPKNDFKKRMGKEELEVIQFLKAKPLDEIVASETKYNEIITLSHKKNTSQRNFWYILANKSTEKLIDVHEIKYLLIGKEELKGFENIKGTEKEFENKKYVVYKIKEGTEFKKADSLSDYMFALVMFWQVRQLDIKSTKYNFFKISSTDTKEEICVMVSEGLKVTHCPAKVSLEIKGKKEVLTELLNSFNKDYLYRKAAYFIRKQELDVYPDEIDFIKGKKYHIKELAYIYAWTSKSPYSQPNLLIGKILWRLKLIG
jgi:hypothetical protein